MNTTRLVHEFVRAVGFALGGLTTLVLSAALVLHFSFDAHRLEAQLSSAAADTYGRGLSFPEGIELQLWPRPALWVPRLVLTEPDSDEPCLKLQGARLSLAWWPLLRQRLVVDGVVVADAEVHLQRDAQGAWSIADLFDSPGANNAFASFLQIAHTQVDALALRWQDVPEDIELTLSKGRWHSGPLGLGAAGRLELAGALKGAGVEAQLALASGYHWTHRQSVSLEGTQLRLQGTLGALTQADVSVDLGYLRRTQDATGEGRRVRLRASGQWAGQAWDVNAELPKLAWQPEGLTSEPFKLSVAGRHDKSQLSLKLEGSGVTRAADAWMASNLTGEFDRRAQDDERLKGKFQGLLRASLKAPAWELANLRADLTVSHPRIESKALEASLAGRLAWQSATPRPFSAQLNVSAGKAKGQFDAGLSSLWPISGEASLVSQGLDSSAFQWAASDFDVSLAALKGHNLSGMLRFSQGKLAGMRWSSVQIPFRLTPVKLSAEPLIEGYGGSIKSQLQMNLEDGQGGLRSQIKTIALADLAQDAQRPWTLSGRLSGDANVQWQAMQLGEIFDRATGISHFVFDEPTFRGIDWLAAMRSSRSPSVLRQARKGERTALKRLRSNFALRPGGVLYTQSLMAETDWLRMTGTGTIGLKDNQLDILMRNTLTAVPASAPDLAPLRNKTVTMRLLGTQSQPATRWELAR